MCQEIKLRDFDGKKSEKKFEKLDHTAKTFGTLIVARALNFKYFLK